MKKKLFKVLSFLLMLITCTNPIYAITPYTIRVKSNQVEPKKIFNVPIEFLYDISDIETLTDSATLIIRAEVLPDKEEVTLIEDVYGFTKTKLKVLEVYAGDVHVDDIISISEEYFTLTNAKTGEAYLRAFSIYKPTIIGQEYIFFLIDYQQQGTARANLYEIANIAMGVFPLENDDFVEQYSDSQDLEEDPRLTQEDPRLTKEKVNYNHLYEEVILKYKVNR